MLDYPKEISYARKYLISPSFSMSMFPPSISKQTFQETVTFLDEKETEFQENNKDKKPHLSYLKKRTSDTGAISYSYIFRFLSNDPQEFREMRRSLSRDDYLHRLSTSKDKNSKPLNRIVSVFIYKGSIYHLETLTIGDRKIRLLRINSKTGASDEFHIPDFIPTTEDITGKLRVKN